MLPLEDSVKDTKIHFKTKLKWYEKIWYFLTGKKNEYKELGPIEEFKGGIEMKIFKKKYKEYVYLVFYHYKNGIGSITAKLTKKISNVEDLVEIQEYIKRENGLENVGVANYQLLCVRKVEEEKDERSK